jgi:hypothetical protein
VASYEEWNRALVHHFSQSVPRGSSVFLAVDDDEIVRVGRNLAAQASEVDDFISAVSKNVIQRGRLNLRQLRGRNGLGEPKGIAFLCVLVLAATRMAEEEDVSEINYFHRLREILDLPDEEGRPEGMSPGSEAEEPLWMEWNRWLQEHSLLPSAVSGEGSRKYINYPLSQALLRKADKDRLKRLFIERRFSEDMDPDTLAARVRAEEISLPQHLRELLHADRERRAAVQEAMHQLYELWRENPQDDRLTAGVRVRALRSSIYRTVDFITGLTTYHFHPKAPRGQAIGQFTVEIDGRNFVLTQERPGWLYPFGRLTGRKLREGIRIPVSGNLDIDYVVLPKRKFWVLVQDPEDPDSGNLAGWTGPQLAEPFLLLIVPELLGELILLKEEGLIEWAGEPIKVLDSEWLEIRNCMAVSEAWSGVFIQDQELFEALKPSAPLSVVVSGGLRVPNCSGWLQGYGPELTIFSFYPEVEVRITRVHDGTVVLDDAQRTGNSFPVAWGDPGDYRVEAKVIGRSVQRLIKLIGWDELESARLACRDMIELDGARLCGASLETLG